MMTMMNNMRETIKNWSKKNKQNTFKLFPLFLGSVLMFRNNFPFLFVLSYRVCVHTQFTNEQSRNKNKSKKKKFFKWIYIYVVSCVHVHFFPTFNSWIWNPSVKWWWMNAIECHWYIHTQRKNRYSHIILMAFTNKWIIFLFLQNKQKQKIEKFSFIYRKK